MLGISLMEVAASFCMRWMGLGGARAMTVCERADWLQEAAATVLKAIGMKVLVEGLARQIRGQFEVVRTPATRCVLRFQRANS